MAESATALVENPDFVGVGSYDQYKLSLTVSVRSNLDHCIFFISVHPDPDISSLVIFLHLIHHFVSFFGKLVRRNFFSFRGLSDG